MCAIFGFLDYGRMVPHKVLTKLLRELSVAAECRGTDATGISYVNNGKMVTFKKAKPAHEVKLYFPKGTTAVIGHTRFTTQGSEKQIYNNHPFEGNVSDYSFALAHNGVLYNDHKIRQEMNLPDTVIETDSYIAVQLLEQQDAVDEESLRSVAETVTGNFVFTVLRSDNTLFLVKGDNPLTIWHYPSLGLYVYASTRGILLEAIRAVRLYDRFDAIEPDDGNIAKINSEGHYSVSTFDMAFPFFYPIYSRKSISTDLDEFDYYDDLMMFCGYFGVEENDVNLLLEYGYSADEIEEMLLDDGFLHQALNEIKEDMGNGYGE